MTLCPGKYRLIIINILVVVVVVVVGRTNRITWRDGEFYCYRWVLLSLGPGH